MGMSSRHLVLLPVFEALDGWLAEPQAGGVRLGEAISSLATSLDLQLGRVRIAAPPLPELELKLGLTDEGYVRELRQAGGELIGGITVAGDPAAADEFSQGLELVFVDALARVRASRAERQLAALDQAVRGISGELDVDRVLQLITDRVRELVDAEYAAIGIVDGTGAIERFITSGISAEERTAIGDLPRGHGLLGLIIRENRAYRIPTIAHHPESYGFPPNHPPMSSFLGLPITNRDQAVGRLYLTNKRSAEEFSEGDQELVEMFALHAGIAIENARLHTQVQRLAIVDERDRISRELHDNVIQSIYGQTLSLDDVPDLVDEDPDEARRRVDDSIDALHAVIRDIRNFIFGLRPVLLESGSLADGVEHLATELRRNGGVEVRVEIDDTASRLPALPIETVAELLAITREALSNVARHAGAETCEIRVSTEDGISLEITDDGRGYDASAATARGHHGLANLRARAEGLGARLEVASAPGRGTRMILRLAAARPASQER